MRADQQRRPTQSWRYRDDVSRLTVKSDLVAPRFQLAMERKRDAAILVRLEMKMARHRNLLDPASQHFRRRDLRQIDARHRPGLTGTMDEHAAGMMAKSLAKRNLAPSATRPSNPLATRHGC